MSLVKNLRRREVEIFGAKRVIRNDFKKDTKEVEEKLKKNDKAKRSKKKTEGK